VAMAHDRAGPDDHSDTDSAFSAMGIRLGNVLWLPYWGSTWGGLRANFSDLASLGLENAQIAAPGFVVLRVSSRWLGHRC